ncbi:magnesium transporter CorA family protein [Hyphomicrobium sulfonivorans]|uniref:magnesium transporter CorA family protein n=1 Tax=Hyphomicrobium sulfonivorans TaxID=121290 RepID=UPI0015715073|nr:magnesium transporter CorA family protein [Hyphomicrobium sulfonivorans]MBI1651228.1 magnesium transporter CorA family protein [Hyphomicrobium sulfonivorans]NSL73164.1 magnesium transporter CorA [Hyphomicrobium sulfonivorans]
MMTIYDTDGKNLSTLEPGTPLSGNSVWIDLLQPTSDEDRFAEEALGVDIPSRAEMREIEPSNRFYYERGAYFMTASIVYAVESPMPKTTPVTFILSGDRLVTVRYAEPRAFPIYRQRVEKGDAPCGNGSSIMTGLIDAIIHRMADLIERIQDEVERLAQSVFDLRGGIQTRNRRLDVVLKRIGKAGDITARAEDSAASLSRMLLYFTQAAQDRGDDPRIRQRIKAALRDINSLLDHTKFLSQRISFILDATLGMISNEQNQIIKLFSVMAVILLPPTLVASVYGMNFKHMPELEWTYGYPWALGLMVLAALGPIIYFRRKGWI